MTKIKSIDSKQYFIESEKVIQIVVEREEQIHRSLSAKEKLQIAEKLLKKSETREEFDALSEEIKDLGFEIEYDKEMVSAIPEEHQMKIAFNRVHEEEQLNEELKRQKEQLFKLVDGIENAILTTLSNIEELEKRKLIGKKIDIILDEFIHKEGRMHSVMGHAEYLNVSGGHKNAEEAHGKGHKFFKALKSIAESPNNTESGIKKPSIFKRVLGGKK